MALVAFRASAQSLDQFTSMPDYIRALLIVPGVAQIYLGQPEGYTYLALGTPTLAAGVGLLSWYLAGAKTDADEWKMDSGLLLQDVGVSFEGYSVWAYLRDYEDAAGYVGPRKGRESYLQLLTAPYDPGISLDYRAIPIVGLELAAFLSPDTLATMGAYFQRGTVSFAGLAMSPWAGLTLETAFALAVNLFVATAEETIFRGIALERLGPGWTAVLFGAVHIPNILTYQTIDAESITQVALQSAFATLAGYYLSVVTVDKGYDFRTAIAYHYWHNVVAMITGFLYDQGKAASTGGSGSSSSGLSIGFSPADLELTISIPLG